MSYDFNTSVNEILQLRTIIYPSNKIKTEEEGTNDKTNNNNNDERSDALTKLIEAYTTFSGVCPMTPLLWMQYAFDSGTMLRTLTLPDNDDDDDGTAAVVVEEERELERDQVLEMECSVLELALEEFPSCALLRLYHFDTLCGIYLRMYERRVQMDGNDDEDDEDGREKIRSAFEEAIDAVGNGSHWNEDFIVVALYNTYIRLLRLSAFESSCYAEVLQLFLRRASTPHMSNGANDSILQDMQTLVISHNSSSSSIKLAFTPTNYAAVEQARRKTCTSSDYTTCLANTLEKDVEIAMNAEGILLNPHDDVFDCIIPPGSAAGDDATEGGGDKKRYQQGMRCNLWEQLFSTPSSSSSSSSSPPPYLMGCGMMTTATAFTTYISSLIRYIQSTKKQIKHQRQRRDRQKKRQQQQQTNHPSEEEEEEEKEMQQQERALKTITSLINPIYERGLSECPTVELLWERYIRHLLYVLEDHRSQLRVLHSKHTTDNDEEQDEDEEELLVQEMAHHHTRILLHQRQITSACNRSVRNCPYSVKLHVLKMRCLHIPPPDDGTTKLVFEPDDLLTVVREAMEGGFVTEGSGCLELYMGACRLVKERIFTLVSRATTTSGGGAMIVSSSSNGYGFDEGEEMTLPNKNKKRRRRKKIDGEDDIDDGVMNLSLVHYARQQSSLGLGTTTSTINDDDDDNEEEEKDQSASQEIEDLLEDLRDMYETTDRTLRKSFTSWTEGRAKLLLERAISEAYVITPMMKFFQRQNGADNEDDDEMEDTNGNGNNPKATTLVVEDKDEAVKWFEKLVRVHQPPHPTSWRSYIRYVMGRAGTTTTTTTGGRTGTSKTRTIGENPGVTMARLRCVRGLYHRAMTTIKKPKQRQQQVGGDDDGAVGSTIAVDEDGKDAEFDAALKHLCEEYKEFERQFGSEGSQTSAFKSTQGKLLESLVFQPELEIVSQSTTTNASLHTVVGEGEEENHSVLKRKRDNGTDSPAHGTNDEPKAKKAKDETEDAETTDMDIGTMIATTTPSSTQKEEEEEEEKKKTNLKVSSNPKNYPQHKVQVGALEHPAHPFTIHVSNLSFETNDLDLVNLFHTRECGAIVHARIFRDKKGGRKGNKGIKTSLAGGVSKGAGLVQFEERESVELALALDGEVGLHERLIKVSRSHQSAVGIVPKGMERVGCIVEGASTVPTGGGSDSHDAKGGTTGGDEAVGNSGGNAMRNQKRKERRRKISMVTSGGGSDGDAYTEKKGPDEAQSTDALMDKTSLYQNLEGNQPGVQKETTSAKPRVSGIGGEGERAQKNPIITPNTNQAMSILAFRPRGVQRQRQGTGQRRKKVVSLEKTKDP